MPAEIKTRATPHGALRFLLIEDNPVDIELVKHELLRAGLEFTLAVVQTPEDFTRELRSTSPDVVMADYNLPSWTGMEGLEILSREGLDIPFILVTGSLGDVTAVDCIKQGATDYVLKAGLARLPIAIRRALGEKSSREQRRAVEKDLEENRQNQLRFKDEFLSHVTHEIRSPLSIIMSFTTNMLDGLAGEINEEQRKYGQIVLKSTRQMRSMINALLEVTRLEAGTLTAELQNLSLADTVSETLNMLNANACAGGVSLSCELPSDLPAAYADPTRLRQILFNLVDNAIKFTPVGGTVKIQARRSEKDSEFLCIEVTDTGSGIEPKNIERIFERLHQTLDDCRPSKNLGLGLFICKGLVMLQGGRIWVESELQKGSTFSFTVPVFSLKKLMRPLIKNDKWPMESAALIMVEICPRDAWTSGNSQEKWFREVRGLLQSCVLPNLDVLLPTITRRSDEGLFFLVAFADEKGATVLADRIREQFERFPHLVRASRNLTVSHAMVNSFVLNGSTSVDDMVTNLVANLEETIRSRSVLRIAHHAP